MTMMTAAPGRIDDSTNRTCEHYRFIPVPVCRQETEYTCGVACVQSVLGCYGMDYRQDELAQILGSKPILGTDYQQILSFMRMLGFQASFKKNMSIDNLKGLIDDGITQFF